MKILILFSSSELGGAERSLTKMAMSSQGIEYSLGSLMHEGEWSRWARSCGLDPILFGFRRFDKSVFSMFGILNVVFFLAFRRFDAVYVCGAKAALFLRIFRPFFSGTKIVHGVRWNPDTNSLLDLFTRFVEKTLSFLVDCWITNSEAAKTTLIERCGVESDKVHVIYNGIDSPSSELPEFSERSCVVVTVANLNPRKGHLEYLSIIGNVLERVPEARFVFIGRDDMRGEVQKAIFDAGLSQNVACVGFLADVSGWLRDSRVFVLPSLWGEGCPTSILEAFSFGLPVIAHSIDGIPELIDDGRDGYLFNPGDPKFADGIVKLLVDQDLAIQLGSAGRQKVVRRFVMRACAEEHKAIFYQFKKSGNS